MGGSGAPQAAVLDRICQSTLAGSTLAGLAYAHFVYGGSIDCAITVGSGDTPRPGQLYWKLIQNPSILTVSFLSEPLEAIATRHPTSFCSQSI